MKELTELSEIYNIPVTTIRYWTHTIPEVGKLFYKKEITRTEAGSPRKRKVFVIDDDNIEKFEAQIPKGKRKKRLSRCFSRGYSWSRTALECYQARLNCSRCQNNYICNTFTKKNQTPPMKITVLNMVKYYGIPPERILEND